jgi:leucyl/phenylalanyl-tRNA---protein transferase
MPATKIFSMPLPRLKFEPGDDSPHWQLVLTLITSSVRDRRRSKIIPASLLVEAYCTGIFPMAMENGEIAWFSPDPRGIILLEAFHIPHGLKRVLKKGVFQIRLNTAFEEVIRACGERAETWISEEIIQSYLNLHRLGFAHSVEAWLDSELAGGLYGVSVYGAFFGESMFHRVPDASKVALVGLVNRLNERGYGLLDTQYVTSHLTTFGAVEISRSKYIRLLKQALALDCKFV